MKKRYKNMNQKTLLSLLIANAKMVYSLSLQTLNPELMEVLTNPEKGDYVLEISSLSFKFDNEDLTNSVGIFKANLGMGNYIIETLDGREIKWTNSDFIVIPNHPFKGKWSSKEISKKKKDKK